MPIEWQLNATLNAGTDLRVLTARERWISWGGTGGGQRLRIHGPLAVCFLGVLQAVFVVLDGAFEATPPSPVGWWGSGGGGAVVVVVAVPWCRGVVVLGAVWPSPAPCAWPRISRMRVFL